MLTKSFVTVLDEDYYYYCDDMKPKQHHYPLNMLDIRQALSNVGAPSVAEPICRTSHAYRSRVHPQRFLRLPLSIFMFGILCTTSHANEL